MRILVLSFYYPPDLSAGSFRVASLVAALRQQVPPDWQLDVVTSLPNRYASFTAAAPSEEADPGFSVRRLSLGTHESGMADQSVAYFAFARQVWRAVASQRYDIVFATSSRLMTAVLGARVAKRTGARLYLDIRDIFADTIQDVLPGPAGALAHAVSSRLEAYAIGRADRVSLVSPGFLEYFRTRYPGQQFSCITNGIDDEFLDTGPAGRRPTPHAAGPEPLHAVYAGNIGEGQGLHRIVPALARRLDTRIRFTIIGDGGRRPALAEALSAAGATNVTLSAPVGRDQLIAAYRDADVLFLHLNDHQAFRKVLPSKVFEYAATGKPILAGVSGFAAKFLRSEVPNASVFEPCNVDDAVDALGSLRLEDAPRTAFVAKYGRATLSRALADDVLSLGRASAATRDD